MFSEPSALEKLNAILHPRIASQIAIEIQQAEGICVIDAALLIEVGLDVLCGYSLGNSCSKGIAVKTPYGEKSSFREDALRRIESQLSDAEREKSS